MGIVFVQNVEILRSYWNFFLIVSPHSGVKDILKNSVFFCLIFCIFKFKNKNRKKS